MTKRGLHVHAMGKEGLALILSHSSFLTHGWENRFLSVRDAFTGKTTQGMVDV